MASRARPEGRYPIEGKQRPARLAVRSVLALTGLEAVEVASLLRPGVRYGSPRRTLLCIRWAYVYHGLKRRMAEESFCGWRATGAHPEAARYKAPPDARNSRF